MSDATEKLWGEYSQANEKNPAQLHRWRLVVNEVRKLRKHDDDVILDLGCGSGALLGRIAHDNPGAAMIGLDIEPKALAIARANLPRARFFEADLNAGRSDALEPLAGRASVIVCSEVLEHLDAPERALALARNLLRKDGHLIVTVPSGWMHAFDRAIGHRRHYTLESLESLLRDGSFTPERMYRWGFPFHTLYRMGIGAMPGSVEQFRDEAMDWRRETVFRVIDWLFRLNVRSRAVGRQLVAVASPA